MSREFLAAQAKKTMEEPDVKRELAGKTVRYYRITTGFPNVARPSSSA